MRRAQNRERNNTSSPTTDGRSNILLNGLAATSSSTAISNRISSNSAEKLTSRNSATVGQARMSSTISSRNDDILSTNSAMLQSSIASSLCNDIINRNNIIERQRQLLHQQLKEKEKQERKFRELLSSSATISSSSLSHSSESSSLQNDFIRYQQTQRAIEELLRDRDGGQTVANQSTQQQDTSLTLLNSLTNQGFLGAGAQVPNCTLGSLSGVFPPLRLQDGCRIHSQVMSAALEGLLSPEQNTPPVASHSLLGAPAAMTSQAIHDNTFQQQLQPSNSLALGHNLQNDIVLREEINNTICDLSMPSHLGRPNIDHLLNLSRSNIPPTDDFNTLLEMAKKVRNHGS